MRVPVILHYHLFKNAGTSVDQVLTTNFGDRWRNHDTDDPAGSVFVTEVEALLDAEPDLLALSSHQMRPPLPARPVIPVVFLRHPIDRFRSIYRFDRRRSAVTPAAVIAHRHDRLADYLRAMLDERPHVVADAQAWLLSDAWDTDRRRRLPIGPEAHAERARHFLDAVRDNGVVGLVERYEESWRRLAPLIAEHHAGFTADAAAQHNSDGARSAHLADRLEEVRAEVGDALYAELVERNGADLDLYAHAAASYDVVEPSISQRFG